MTADVAQTAAASRVTDRPGDASPFALGLLLRRAHWRAAGVMEEALRPLGIELRHFAVLMVLVDRGSTVQRDLAAATGSDKAGIMRVVDDLVRPRAGRLLCGGVWSLRIWRVCPTETMSVRWSGCVSVPGWSCGSGAVEVSGGGGP
jgi:hypothetical protein